MRIKFSWIPFIPVTILSVVLRVYQLLFIQKGVDTGFLTSEAVWLIYACMVAVLFIVIAILSVADKKTSSNYTPKINILGGVFAILTGAALIYSVGYNVGGFSADSGTFSVSGFVDVFFGILGCIALEFMGFSSLTGKNIAKKMGVFSVAAPLWCCVKMVTTFISYTKQSVNSRDMTNLFVMAFLTLALFNISMLYQNVKTKNPVKGVILYGMPGFVVTIVYAVADAINQITANGTYDVINSMDILVFVLLAFYVLCIIFELTFNAKSVDEVEEVGEIKEDKKTVKPVINTVKINDNVKENTDDKSGKISNVDDIVNKEMSSIDNVVDAVNKDDNDPDKFSPDKKEYYDNRQDSNENSSDDELNQSLDNINRLIDEINAGE